MSWLWGGGQKNTEGKGDLTQSLQPDLKDFLDKQQPRPYTTIEEAKSANTSGNTVDQIVTQPNDSQNPDDRPLPRESLYQDGRYKHIWRSYVPQDQTVVQNATTAERIITSKKDRREMIHRAAMENCAFEEELKLNCFSTGSALNRARATMTMCNQETKTFNRCYQLQAKFLQALGYLSDPASTNEEEEKIQMHADKLYHRMMDYEAAVEEARASNKPIPPLTSVFNPKKPAPTIDQIDLPSNMEHSLKKPLHELPPHERELAARAVLQEAKLAQVYADDFFKYTTTLNEGRKERQRWLVDAFGPTLGKFFIPDPPEEHKYKTFSPDELDREIWNDKSGTAVHENDAASRVQNR